MSRPVESARGFTLLEVLLALSIALALGALVVPAMARRIAGATGEAVSKDIRSAVAEARADAVRESVALRVEIVVDGAVEEGGGPVRVVAREFRAQGAGEAPARFVGPVFDEPETAVGEIGEASDRELLELPRGTRVSREAPAGGEGFDEGGEALGAFGAMDPGEGERVCIGVLLSTGGSVAGAPVYLSLPDSWTLVVSLDAWTGDAVVTRWVEPAADDGWGAGSEQDAGQER